MQYWKGKNFIYFCPNPEIGEMHKGYMERQMFLLQNHTAVLSCIYGGCWYIIKLLWDKIVISLWKG